MILAGKQLDENLRKKEDLFNFVNKGEALVLVGAGSSKVVEYPLWFELLKKLEEVAININSNLDIDNKRDQLAYADAIRQHIIKHTGNSKRFDHVIHELFKPYSNLSNSTKFHENLIKIPFRGLITTNYDLVLEDALSKVEKGLPSYDTSLIIKEGHPEPISEFLISLNHPSNYHRKILHLHGIYSDNESIILTADDYKKYYGFNFSKLNSEVNLDRILKDEMNPDNLHQLIKEFGFNWTLHRKVLWSLLATRRVVFIGFSMTDPYIIKMLDIVCNDLCRFEGSVHYLISRITIEKQEIATAHAEKLNQSYGVETVFFEDDNSYSGIKRFIEELYEHCEIDFATKKDISTNSGKTIKSKSTQKGSLPDWIKKHSDKVNKP